MQRDYWIYLDDILQAVRRIRQYSNGLSRDELSGNEMALDAVIRNLEVIGEAVKQLPMALRDAHPGVDWKRIAGLRDVLIHQYFGIDLDIIWDVLQNKLARLEAYVAGLVEENDQSDETT